MSETVLFIGILHAIPILLVGLLSRNSNVVFITAIIMGAIGFVTGSPAYIAFDLLGVLLGIGLVELLGLTKKKKIIYKPKKEKYSPESSVKKKPKPLL